MKCRPNSLRYGKLAFSRAKHRKIVLRRRSIRSRLGWFAARRLSIEVALTANRVIHIRATNQFNPRIASKTFGEGCIALALNAYGFEFGNMLSERNELENVAKRFSLEGAIKSCDDNSLAHIGHLLAEISNTFELK